MEDEEGEEEEEEEEEARKDLEVVAQGKGGGLGARAGGVGVEAHGDLGASALRAAGGAGSGGVHGLAAAPEGGEGEAGLPLAAGYNGELPPAAGDGERALAPGVLQAGALRLPPTWRKPAPGQASRTGREPMARYRAPSTPEGCRKSPTLDMFSGYSRVG